MSVRVIVVNWNGRRWLDGCFTALRQQDSPAAELVLVDNGSRDDSVAHTRAAFPEVQIVAIDRNVGFAGGSNASARNLTGFLCF
jgi:GT2 family glycosyltransferase